MMKRNRFKGKAAKDSGEVELQVTSLADILIVVLVFLLKSVSTDIENMESVSLPNGVKLPTVTKGVGAKDGIKIEVTSTTVSVAGDVASRLRQYRFQPDDLNRDLERGGTSKSLQRAIAKVKNSQEHQGKSVWVIADQRAPYATIQTILASVAIHGYENFKLAVLQSEE